MTPSRPSFPLIAAALAALISFPASRGEAASMPPAIAKIAQAAVPAVVDIESIDPMKGKSGNDAGPPSQPENGVFEKSSTERADTGTLIVPPRAEQALGTGFFISPTGYIVTNHHVIKGASEINVTLHDGRVFTAKVVGSDEKADLAVLKIDAPHPVPYLQFGNSGRLDLGDWVVAVGNPFGLGFSVSAGVVSALHRDIGSGPYDDFIQTDAAINRGNSGGPLLNAEGLVVGVDSAIYSPSGGSVGIGFAIPSSMVEPVAKAIIADGAMHRGWTGLRVEHVSDDMKMAWHLASTDGVVVGGVVAKGPSAGKLVPGDIITSVNGKLMRSVHAFKVAIAEIPVGGTVHVRFEAAGATHETAIAVASPPKPGGAKVAAASAPASKRTPSKIAALGAEVETHPGAEGVIVVGVTKDGPAERAGLHPDALIKAVGPNFVTTPEALAANLANRRTVALLVEGPGGTSWISVRLGETAKTN